MLHLAGKTPPGGPRPDRAAQAAALNIRYRHHGATAVLAGAFRDIGRVALVSSFGADSVVLLHMLAVTDNTRPVIFIDTGMMFAETLVYQHELTERLTLRNLRILRAADMPASDHTGSDTTGHGATGPCTGGVGRADPRGDLHRHDPDACCALRKARPLHHALAGYDGWITGRKRFQSGARATLDFFEAEPGTGRIKINPLAHWSADDIQSYMTENRLPRHPLVARGYPSIGCAPCTSPVRPGEDIRAGRWRAQTKDECGIHFVNGKPVRTGASS
ncbi:MAG: phosphoadenylyl-sulfate reductase [Rhodobacteraceae bacterium]|nr:phosphoadenylyl-sulfate reductase [Paracoccaceae bacterium]